MLTLGVLGLMQPSPKRITKYRVNLAGCWDYREGYGYFTNGLARALARNKEVKVVPLALEQLLWPPWRAGLAGVDLASPTIVCFMPQQRVITPGRLIYYTMVESLFVNPNWVNILNANSAGVLVPSQFCADVFTEHGVNNVHLVPGGVEIEDFPIVERIYDRPFTFMALGDRGARKAFDVVWRAYGKAFEDVNDVRLIVKTRGHNLKGFSEARSVGEFLIWRQDIPPRGMADAYEYADCFVFPSRGEGYGLPPRETAAMGIPTICSSWAAMDDADKWAIPLEKYTLEDCPFGGQWFEPDVDELAEKMRWVYENYAQAKHNALEKAQYVRQNMTWDHTVEALLEVFREWRLHSREVTLEPT